jgi:Protein of unknown function (DUF1566)
MLHLAPMLAGAVLLLVTTAASAPAQLTDHLKCYQMKDPLNLAGTADLDTPQFGVDPGCKISKAKLFCVPSRKTTVNVIDKTTGNPITLLPVSGPDPGDRICYKVKCPTPAVPIPDQAVTDQFGTRTLTKFKASYLCTPAVKGTFQRFVDNADGTVTDNQTGLQWEQKTGSVGDGHTCTELSCPAGDTFSGAYTASSPCGGGTFTVTVSAGGTTWTGTTSGDTFAACNGALSGSISGVTFTGTGPFGVTVDGTVDCTDAQITGTFFGPVSGLWMVTSTNYCPDPHDVNNTYPWSNSGTAPDGPAFTDFLGKLNNCTSGDGTAVTNVGFAGHCDWRLPAVQELQTILLAPFPCFPGPCIDPTFGPTVANNYWSATTNAMNPNSAWNVFFSFGLVNDDLKINGNYVRGVRSGS